MSFIFRFSVSRFRLVMVPFWVVGENSSPENTSQRTSFSIDAVDLTHSSLAVYVSRIEANRMHTRAKNYFGHFSKTLMFTYSVRLFVVRVVYQLNYCIFLGKSRVSIFRCWLVDSFVSGFFSLGVGISIDDIIRWVLILHLSVSDRSDRCRIQFNLSKCLAGHL